MDRPLHLVLTGGGHAMLPTLVRAREWIAAGVGVTLLDPQPHLYYSGMVPEYLGGVYDQSAIRVDLARVGVHAVKQGPTLRTNLDRPPSRSATAVGRPGPTPSSHFGRTR